jgi:hypothetical protein
MMLKPTIIATVPRRSARKAVPKGREGGAFHEFRP